MAKHYHKKKSGLTRDRYSGSRLLPYADTCAGIGAIGERSNGKSYVFKKECLMHFKATGQPFAYVRWWNKYVVYSQCSTVFKDFQPVLDDLFGKGTTINYDRTAHNFYLIIDGGEPVVCGHVFSVENAMNIKGNQYAFPPIKRVFFDEIIDYDYPRDAVSKWLNLLSTIARNDRDLLVYYAGNPIVKECPLFDLWKIKLSQLKAGEITVARHRKGASIAIERTKKYVVDGVKENDPLFGFDDSTEASMILYGDWECRKMELRQVDGVSWNDRRRRLIPIYVSGLGKVFELSIITEGHPIAFIRAVNVQRGEVSKEIVLHLRTDEQTLRNVNGIVPSYTRPAPFWSDETKKVLDVFMSCVNCGRAVYADPFDGTDFLHTIKHIYDVKVL